MNSTLRAGVDLFSYAALRGAFALLHAFDPDENMRTAAAVGSTFCRLSRRHRERAMAHISQSMPHLSPAEVGDLAERSMQSMFQLFMVESVSTPRVLTPTSWPSRVRMGDVSKSLRVALADGPAIFVTGHCGNWELLGYMLALLGFPMTALARPLDNPWLNDWMLGVREARGLQVLTKWGATGRVQEILAQGGRVAFIADQNAGDDGLFVPFFGRLASSYKSIGLLAMRHRAPIVVGAALRQGGRFRYELTGIDVILPEEWDAVEDPLLYITARFNRGIEDAVRRAPEQYLWVHRRWKSRPRWEREGSPMPERYAERLRTLPWMTEAIVESCRLPVATAGARG